MESSATDSSQYQTVLSLIDLFGKDGGRSGVCRTRPQQECIMMKMRKTRMRMMAIMMIINDHHDHHDHHDLDHDYNEDKDEQDDDDDDDDNDKLNPPPCRRCRAMVFAKQCHFP